MNEESINDFLVESLAKILEVGNDDIDTSVSFDRYGLDSVSAVKLTGEIEETLKKEVEPTLLYDYPTIDELSKFLATL